MESVREWEMQFKEKYDYVGRLLKPGEEPSEYTDEEDTKDHSKQDWTWWTTKARGLQNCNSYSFQRMSSLWVWCTCCEKHFARVYKMTCFTRKIWIWGIVCAVCTVWWASSSWKGDRAFLTARKSPGSFDPSPPSLPSSPPPSFFFLLPLCLPVPHPSLSLF